MDMGSWIAIGALAIAAGALLVTVLSNRRTVKHEELNELEELKARARTGYVDEVAAELALFRQKFNDADKHMKQCEEDLRRLNQDYQTLKGQNFALMQSLLPRTPLIIQGTEEKAP